MNECRGPLRILITDDDQVCALLLTTLLKPYGTCQVVGNGEDAVTAFTTALLRQQPFELVCLDIQMPGINGQATLRCLRAIEAGFGRLTLQGATILMVTSQDDSRNVFTAFASQCEGYLVKPIDQEQLVQQLANLGIRPGGGAAPGAG